MRTTTKFLFLAGLAMCLSACLPQPPSPDGGATIFRRPSRYGWGSPSNRSGQQEKPPREQPSTGNRFGHSGDDDHGSDDGGTGGGNKPPAGGSGDDKPPAGGSGGGDKPPAGGSGGGDKPPAGGSGGGTSSGPPSNLNEYPYARLVPGKKGFVTLPGADAAVGEIDVTGIKPGTPVEINDPRDPSKKIYFRVP